MLKKYWRSMILIAVGPGDVVDGARALEANLAGRLVVCVGGVAAPALQHVGAG
jgi:hypothetical protein